MKSALAITLVSLFSLVTAVSHVEAETPPDPDANPTANTGALKAQILTAGSYDAHSGNATRAVTDLNVPGAVGVYGLDLTRYWNSLRDDRDRGNLYPHFVPEPVPNQPTDFGSPGWSHSWSWRADYEEYSEEVEQQDAFPDPPYTIATTLITITFPDGHASKYKIQRYGPVGSNVTPGRPYSPAEANWTGGFHDRLVRMATNGSEFWLYRADGGAVHFIEDSTWGYQAREVFDPHGLLTTLHYNNEGNLDWVEQDGGRRLTFRWDFYCKPDEPTHCWSKVIGRVENAGSAGTQAVEYQYSWFGGSLTLTSAVYQNDPVPGQTVSSLYTYLDLVPPDGFFYAGPLLATANDPRFDGPMRSISYSYAGSGCRPVGQPPPDYPNGQFDYFYASPTAIEDEKSGETGAMVSRFAIGCFDGTRFEYTGLGGFRRFFFGRSAGGPGTYSIQGYQLAKLTDFTTVYPLPASLPFVWQNYFHGHPREIWDGRDILTETVYGDGSGLPVEIRHLGSDSSVYYYDRVTPGNSEAQDPNRVPNDNHHWLFSKTDERGPSFKTLYTRDARRRVTTITHPDGSLEHFTDNTLNQVETHTLASGAVQHYVYDGQGLLQQEWNSVDGPGEATTYTYYSPGNHPEWTGLVATARNPRAAYHGAAYSTKMEYNGRYQITKVHYPPAGGNGDPTVSYGYDIYGNCTSITNELGHTSTYEYDSYRRCIRYTEPLNAHDWKGTPGVLVPSRTWDWIYDRYGPEIGERTADTHTKNEWRIQIEPAFNGIGERKMTARWHDLQNRIVREETGWIQPPGPIPYGNPNWYWSNDGEIHSFTYDENGQKKSDTLHIAPANRVTTYEYDLRNRLEKTNQTADTIPRTTTTLYDVAGNKTDVTFPDSRSQHWRDYDAFGQAWSFIDERNQTTSLTYCWGPMKKLYTVTTRPDGGGPADQLTIFSYDLVGRPTQILFPDQSDEFSTYDFGQLKTWKTRRNQVKTVVYDVRGREMSHSWSDGVTPAIARSWDDANRLTSISNIWSSIDYAYDEAGQVLWEGNEIAGSGPRTQTNYFRYPDGSVGHLYYPGGTYLRKDYTARGQLAAVGWDDDDDNWWRRLAHYTYLPDGKVGQVDYGNGMRTATARDQRGFIEILDHYRVTPAQDHSWRQYTRDERDRIISFQKSDNLGSNPLENGRGDRFRYDDEGQLQEAWYNAVDPANSGAGNTRYDGFSYDALGNRGQNNYVASRGLTSFFRRDTRMNQYSSWTPSIVYYDDNFGAPPVTPPWAPPGNGVMMADGWITASYNAMNQPVAMWSFTYHGTPNFMWFGYDPLGRCVKRWVGASGDFYSNPATYFHYDGWNLLQEGNNTWGPERVYVHGNRVDEIVWSYKAFTGEKAYHHYDARGHCTLLTDSVGNVLEQYEYDAFGQPYFYDASGNSIGLYDFQGRWAGYSLFGNRFLFTGREWLSDVKLYDYRNRMYQPELGRFLQPDPKHFTAGDYNLYRYCHNDPINRTDPDGLYGRGDGWEGKDKEWQKFDRAQQAAAGRLEKASEKMDAKAFEKAFGKGSATAENMAKVQKTMQGMAAALRDDGSKGYVANAFSDKSRVLGRGDVNGKTMSINLGHSNFNNKYQLSWASGHESGHNLGLGHGTVNGVTAYKYGNEAERDAYKNLPAADRLGNPDNYMDFAR